MIGSSIIPKKSLGQHFLIDKNIARKIVSSLKPQPNQTIVEIGPGNGVLTEILLQHDIKIFAIDIDQRATAKLKDQFSAVGNEKLTIMHEDILTTQFSKLSQDEKLRVIGNLPYNITSPILFHLINHRNVISDAVLMMQREVAERICSSPKSKEYGIPSVFLQLHADIKILFHVTPNVFYPKPKVESSVISLSFKENLVNTINDYDFFKRIVRESFGMRRKTLLNGLKSMNIQMDVTMESINKYLSKRPEELSVEDFIFVSNELAKTVTIDHST